MIRTSAFFKVFPPPKFLEMPYAGIDISDSSVHCLMYRHSRRGLRVDRFGSKSLPKGAVEAGVIRDPAAVTAAVRALAQELKVTYVKASLPEERMYLFKTEVPNGTAAEIHENIGLRIEENVPLPAAETVFYFDLIRGMPADQAGRNLASVSATSIKAVMGYFSVLEAAGLVPMSFEVVAKSLSRAVVRKDDRDFKLIVHIMDGKTGLYVVGGNTVMFTSTIPFVLPAGTLSEADAKPLGDELRKVYLYWSEHGAAAPIREVLLCGHRASAVAALLAGDSAGLPKAAVADVWANAFSYEEYLPPLSQEESLEYAVAAGLALPMWK